MAVNVGFCHKKLLETGYPYTQKNGQWLRHDLLAELVAVGLSTEEILPKVEHLPDFDKEKISKALEGIREKGTKPAGCPKKQAHFPKDIDIDCTECPKEIKEYYLGDGIGVRDSPTGLILVRYKKVKEDEVQEIKRLVVKGHVQILERLDVDGTLHYRVLLDDDERLLCFKGLVKDLRDSARVLNKRNLEDVLSATISACPNFRVAHATFGVYDESDELSICITPMPVKEEQKKAWSMVAHLVGREATSEEIQDYIDIIKCWHNYEILPMLGLGIAAPFAFLFRSMGMLFPHAFNYALETDLGKSLVAILSSEKMWGLEVTSGPALNAEYRLASHLDAICLPQAVDEAERIKRDLWPTLKESAERRLADKRGTPGLGMRDYLSREVLFFTGNSLPIDTESVLKRFEVVRFDSSVRSERLSYGQAVDRLYKRLQPIGFQLLRWALDKWRTKDALLTAFEEWQAEIRANLEVWSSPKRPEAWACTYLGLKMLENGCKQVGIEWEAPSINSFVKAVVMPVETSTRGFARLQAETFTSWFALYRSEKEYPKKVYDDDDEYRSNPRYTTCVGGEGKLFKQDVVDKVPGYWVTMAIYDKYNERKEGEERLSSLAELGRQCADIVGLPYKSVLDSDGVSAKVVNMGKGSARAVFVPDVIREYSPGEKPHKMTERDQAKIDGYEQQEEKLKIVRDVLKEKSVRKEQERELEIRLGADWHKWAKHLSKEGAIICKNPDSRWEWVE